MWQPDPVRTAGETTLERDAGAPAEWRDAQRDPFDDVTAVRRQAARFGPRPDDPTMRDALREFVRRYGWRAYALPVLTVITIAALFTTGRGAPAQAAHRTASGQHPVPAATATATTTPPECPT